MEHELKLANKTAFAVISNTDLTEGRGLVTIEGLYESESHALAAGKGKYVMGSDCPIRQYPLAYLDNVLYGPVSVVPALSEFKKTDEKLKKKREAIEKARSLGLTKEELQAIMG